MIRAFPAAPQAYVSFTRWRDRPISDGLIVLRTMGHLYGVGQ